MPDLEIDSVITPAELADKLGWPERSVRRKAREIGACHVLGKRMVFTKADVEALLEATRVKPRPPLVRQSSMFATSRASPHVDYETARAVLLREEAKQRAAKRRARISELRKVGRRGP